MYRRIRGLCTRSRPAVALAVAFGTAPFLTGCRLLGDLTRTTPEETLVAAVGAATATAGRPLADGRFGRTPVDTVISLEDSHWEAVIPDPKAPTGERRWDITVAKVSVFPVRPGEDFARWLNAEDRKLDRRAMIPSDAFRLLAEGRILAVGSADVLIRRTDRSSGNKVDQVAYLRPDAAGGDPTWEMEPRTRTPVALRDALRRVYDEMIFQDERVITCMGTDASGAPRDLQLQCVGKVLEARFPGG